MISVEALRPRAQPRAPEDVPFPASLRSLRQEMVIRASVCLFIIGFNEVLGVGTGIGADRAIRITAALGLLLNGPYYLAARTGHGFQRQAYARMLIDITCLTGGLLSAGGLAAAPYLGVYTFIPVYAAIVLSATACFVATGVSTALYLACAYLQYVGWFPVTVSSLPKNAWNVAAFNLLIINLVGALTAILAEAYRRSRTRLASLYQELERAHDESLRLNAEIQRASQLQMLAEVAGGVTHEIRNVLTAAFGHLEMARQKVRTAAPNVLPHLQQLQTSCEASIRIVENTLQMARQQPQETVPVSLAEVARRTIELTGYDLRRHGISVQLDFPADFPPVAAVPFRLQQVLLNLVTNAQDALRGRPAPKIITIAARTEPGYALVEVRDTGSGIPPDVLPRIFEPFYTTKATGTGLGLAISSNIVAESGGELTATNGPEGGAVFRLRLPIAKAEGPGGAPTVSPRSA